MAEVRFEGVRKRFRDTEVVKGIDLTIRDGEFFTFVGPSGCGKSTILNMIAGLEPVTGGRIYFNGTLVNELPPKDRDVAMVFQSYALYPHMDVYENIAFPLRMKKVDRLTIDTKVREIVSLLGLGEMLKRKPKELSGGQRQRVALGRAMVRRPKVFLMDEPLSNLDARLRIEMRTELKRLHQELRITTVYVTHDQGEALSLSERIAVLHEGEIQQCGTSHEVYARPSNIFVAGFIGSPPMNIFPCTVQEAHPPGIRCNGLMFPLMPEYVQKKNEVILGIRPEDVHMFVEKSEGGVEATVSVIEPAGSFHWVDVVWGGIAIKGIAVPDEGMKPGGPVFMTFSMEQILVFDAASGRRLETGI
jgi:multiple sugar transport system ATP-binding protein